MKHALQNTYKT